MLFNSYSFLLFFPIVCVIYYIIPTKARNAWLLFTSYYFYMCWSIKYVILLVFVTSVTFIGGLALEKINRYKKVIVSIFSIVSLSVLFIFKYLGWICDNILNLLAIANIQVGFNGVSLVLPMGISFYTFQALGYLIDVYREKISAIKNPFRYALFISFFPQLVAGPIERSNNLLHQFDEIHSWNSKKARDGILLMMWGFFLKLAIADNISIIVDTVYGNYYKYNGFFIVIASILFAIQIYCDFYGYSVIAKGAANILGFELMDNFKSPYLAQDVAGFWRRWHISLTSWFLDYVYIPLGGNRKGKFRKQINKLIVFLLSGLWHGANWTYVVWGSLNGLYQIIGEYLQPIRYKAQKSLCINENSLGIKICKIVITFVLIDFTWIFFRSNSIDEAFSIIAQMFAINNLWILTDGSIYTLGLNSLECHALAISIFILLVIDYMNNRGIVIRDQIYEQNLFIRWIIYFVSFFYIILVGHYGSTVASTFIYFAF